MALFKKHKQESAKAAVLKKEKLISGTKMDTRIIEDIVKTTDSMKLISNATAHETDSEKLTEASLSLSKSYDLAVKKIDFTYQDIVETKKVISSSFIAVQILIKIIDKKPDITHILNIIEKYFTEIEAQLSNGKTIWFSEKFVLEPTIYVNKMIPTARVVTKDFMNINTVTWEGIFQGFLKSGHMAISDSIIVSNLIEAIITNLWNGYYIKLGNLVVARTNGTGIDLMVLFSKQTIERINRDFAVAKKERRKGKVVKSNYVDSYKNQISDDELADKELRKVLVNEEKEKILELKEKEKEILEKEEKLSKMVENAKDVIDKKKKIEEEFNSATNNIEDEILKETLPRTEEISELSEEEILGLVNESAKSDIKEDVPYEIESLLNTNDEDTVEEIKKEKKDNSDKTVEDLLLEEIGFGDGELESTQIDDSVKPIEDLVLEELKLNKTLDKTQKENKVVKKKKKTSTKTTKKKK